MNKKAFTLVELLGVIVILSLIMIFALPKIVGSVKSSGDTVDNLTMDMVKKAADMYIDNYSKKNGTKYCITLSELVDIGLLQTPITLKKSNEEITNTKSVKIIFDNGKKYELVDNDECSKSYIGVNTVYIQNAETLNLLDYKIYGNSIQYETPTALIPVEINNLGELVTDTSDSNYGKYKITIKVTGKNLFEGDIKFYNPRPTTNWILFEEGKQYTFSYQKADCNSWRVLLYVYNLDKTSVANFPNGEYEYLSSFYSLDNTTIIQYGMDEYTNKITVTCLKSFYAKDISFLEGDTTDATIIEDFMIEQNSELTSYEAYKEREYNIYLSEPLRCINDICDYIDFKEGKVVRNIGNIDNYNNETIRTNYISNTGELSNGANIIYVLDTSNEEYINLPELRLISSNSYITVEGANKIELIN